MAMKDGWRKALLLALMGGVLAACRLEADFPIYSRDIVEAAESGKPIPITYDLLVPIPSAKECDKYTQEVGQIVMPFFRKAEPRGCFSKGLDSYLKLRAETSIYPRDEGFSLKESIAQQKAAKEPFAIYVFKRGKALCAGLSTEPDSINAMLTAVREKHAQSPTEFGFRFQFNNDMRGQVTIIVRDVFVDGEPVVDESAIKVARRDEKTIQPSNVREAALWRFAWADVMCLASGDEEGGE